MDSERLHVYTFGNIQKPSLFTGQRVYASLQSWFNSDSVIIVALQVTQVCQVRSSSLDEHAINRLRERWLLSGDHVYQKTQHRNDISVLIGSDYYWQAETGYFERLSGSITAVETIFGWIVHETYTHSFRPPAKTTTTLFVSCTPCSGFGDILYHSEKWGINEICISDPIGPTDFNYAALITFINNLVEKNSRYGVPLTIN